MSIRHQQIRPAFVGGIEESCSPANVRVSRLGQVGLRANIGKAGIALVFIESVRLERIGGDEQIEPAVMIEIGCIHAHRALRLAGGIDGRA